MKELMEKIAFEDFLFQDGKENRTNDLEFCVDRLLMLPKIRPHQLEKAVCLSAEYCQIDSFRKNLLKKINDCPVLLYHLYKRGIFRFEEIEPLIKSRSSFIICYYFWKEIDNFDSFIKQKKIPANFDETFIEKGTNIDHLIENGFFPSSIEYYLKYDDINSISSYNLQGIKTKWSPFEWSYRPKYLDLLSFSGFFGSIRCFKFLLMSGFGINNAILSMVVCGGCLDLFHLCQEQGSLTHNDSVFGSAIFCQLSILVFMIENGAKLNIRNKDVELFNVIILFYIVLLKMVILVLLNI